MKIGNNTNLAMACPMRDKRETRTTEAEGHISAADSGRRYERAVRYLLLCDMELTARCEDLQNRLRWNNLRMHWVPEGSEGEDAKDFAKELIQTVLDPMPKVNLQSERAHQSLTTKSKNPNAIPRSLIVKFVDYSVKYAILRRVWSQKLVYKDRYTLTTTTPQRCKRRERR